MKSAINCTKLHVFNIKRESVNLIVWFSKSFIFGWETFYAE